MLQLPRQSKALCQPLRQCRTPHPPKQLANDRRLMPPQFLSRYLSLPHSLRRRRLPSLILPQHLKRSAATLLPRFPPLRQRWTPANCQRQLRCHFRRMPQATARYLRRLLKLRPYRSQNQGCLPSIVPLQWRYLFRLPSPPQHSQQFRRLMRYRFLSPRQPKAQSIGRCLSQHPGPPQTRAKARLKRRRPSLRLHP